MAEEKIKVTQTPGNEVFTKKTRWVSNYRLTGRGIEPLIDSSAQKCSSSRAWHFSRSASLIKSIELTADSNREFFLIHGYTGGPTDFQQLPQLLNEKFNANVRVLLLPGHGTKVEDLDNVTYEDFKKVLIDELDRDIKKGREIVLGGVSFGGLFSLLLSAQYPSIRAVFNVSSPYVLKFPFNIPLLEILGNFVPYWNKFNTKKREKELHNGSFSYYYMHTNGLRITKQLIKEIAEKIGDITIPILTISTTTDYIGHQKSFNKIQNSVGSKIKKKRAFSSKPHNMFFSFESDGVCEEIVSFIEEVNVFSGLKKPHKKIAVIIPSYNEALRIKSILNVITKVQNIDDIIVVDDGSTDNTEEIVKKFKDIHYVRNETNIGKAGSMDKGVSMTDADILFFCDADLIGLTPEIVKNIIKPVADGTADMFIGLRNNIMQKSVHLFAINSGERALLRSVWERLPPYFKHRYRVEAGLNYCAKKYFNGFQYKTFNYSQPIKEKKYGFIIGTILRWWMNLDVFLAYFRIIIGEFFRSLK